MKLFDSKWKIIFLATLGLLVVFSGVGLGASESIPLFVKIGSVTDTSGGPGEYLNAFYIWSIGVAAALAMLMIVIGGVQYTLSAGSIGSKDAAKKRITSAVLGLLILLSITLILTTINPKLLRLDPGDQAELEEARRIAVETRLAPFLKTIANFSSTGFDPLSAEQSKKVSQALVGIEGLVASGDAQKSVLLGAIETVNKTFKNRLEKGAYQAWLTFAVKQLSPSDLASLKSMGVSLGTPEEKDNTLYVINAAYYWRLVYGLEEGAHYASLMSEIEKLSSWADNDYLESKAGLAPLDKNAIKDLLTEYGHYKLPDSFFGF